MKYIFFLVSIFVSLSGFCQSAGSGILSSIEAKANQIDKNDTKVAELNRQHLETYSLEADKLARLKKELKDLMTEKDLVLDDYRKGYFCSGCDKPRSQFGPGETFPHAGQKIVPAPPEKIAAKEKEFDDKISRKQQEVKNFEFSENEYTKKRTDIDKQLNNLKAQSDKLREEIVALSKEYKAVVVNDAKSFQKSYINELMQIVAEKHFIEDRINIISVKMNDLNKEENEAVNATKDKVTKQAEEEKITVSNKLEANKGKGQQIKTNYESQLDELNTKKQDLLQKIFELKKQLQSSSSMTADQKKTTESLLANTEDRLDEINNSINATTKEYAEKKNEIQNEYNELINKQFELNSSLFKRQQDAAELVKKAFSLRRKILQDAKVARTVSLEQTGNLLLSKKASVRKKFMEYASVVDNERVRLLNACSKAGASCYGADTHGTIVGNWNTAEGCVGQMDALHNTSSPVFGCEEESSVYRQLYSSYLNGLSDSDLESLQRQSGKTRYDLILRKITN
ncbi:MAG: hypothetical protein FGM46_00880 [Ferruginibacter sp.]|nr:hypothetical protein [Ferruginibacter sp.]